MQETVPVTAVADYIVKRLHDCGEPATNLKVQKLVYYCQAWYLAQHGRPLFSNKIKAWVHGPVVPELWHYYKDQVERGWMPLPEPPADAGAGLSREVIEHIDSVLETYGPLTAMHLELLTHQEEPWQAARPGLAADEQSDAEINAATMEKFYRAMMQDVA